MAWRGGVRNADWSRTALNLGRVDSAGRPPLNCPIYTVGQQGSRVMGSGRTIQWLVLALLIVALVLAVVVVGQLRG